MRKKHKSFPDASSETAASQPSLPNNARRSEWRKFLASFGYAFSGLWYALRTQRNARVHATIAVLVVIAGLLLHLSALEFAIVFVAIVGVFIAEMLNTVFEVCVDLSSPNYHPLAKIAKDMAAGAVLLSAMLAAIVGLLIFGPHLLQVLFHR